MYTNTLAVFNPWRELNEVSKIMDQVLFGATSRPGTSKAPAVNLWATEEGAALSMELPGVEAKNLDISVEGKVITIKGVRHKDELSEDATLYRSERWHGQFERKIRLPFSVEPDSVKAQLTSGVLKVSLPKAEAEKPKKIAITA